jgi:mannose-1-phosphate guanylyltransferase
MYTILLSGGSGKRLWPLSNAARSKQYIRFLADKQTGKPCSMVQRMWGQLKKAGLTQNCVICAGGCQEEILRSQLGSVNVAVEPEGHDTFPAVALSCTYLKNRMKAGDDDIVCILPADSYTDQSYFEALKHMPAVLSQSGAQIVLMGVIPTSPSENYGYILPKCRVNGYLRVEGFVEKPNTVMAKELLKKGALWNGGVFCLRIGTVLDELVRNGLPCDYDALCRNYQKLPAVSFDYAVLEKCNDLAAVVFDGMWKDIGTWSAVSKILDNTAQGNCLIDPSCRNVCVINETNIPVVTLDTHELMIIASTDGILVTDNQSDLRLKQAVSALPPRPTFEERSWGTATVLDFCCSGEIGYLIKRLLVRAGKGFGPQCEELDGSMTVLEGNGKITLGEEEKTLLPGRCFQIPKGKTYCLHAGENLLLIQTQIWPKTSCFY